MSLMIEVPAGFRRGGNLPDESRAQSGLRSFKAVLQSVGHDAVDGLNILDIGCGDRITAAILAFDLPVARYWGVETYKPLVDWFGNNVSDRRLRHFHVEFFNAMYNAQAPEMTKGRSFGIGDERFDLIMATSVFTHMYPHDSDIMLYMMRRHAVESPDTRLFISCFLSEEVTLFEAKHWERPLLRFFYNPSFMRDLLAKNGWEIVREVPTSRDIHASFICRPVACPPLPAWVGESSVPAG